MLVEDKTIVCLCSPCCWKLVVGVSSIHTTDHKLNTCGVILIFHENKAHTSVCIDSFL